MKNSFQQNCVKKLFFLWETVNFKNFSVEELLTTNSIFLSLIFLEEEATFCPFRIHKILQEKMSKFINCLFYQQYVKKRLFIKQK
jgi:hypothetical protein